MNNALSVSSLPREVVNQVLRMRLTLSNHFVGSNATDEGARHHDEPGDYVENPALKYEGIRYISG